MRKTLPVVSVVSCVWELVYSASKKERNNIQVHPLFIEVSLYILLTECEVRLGNIGRLLFLRVYGPSHRRDTRKKRTRPIFPHMARVRGQ